MTKILVIDDDPDVRMMLGLMLETSGFDVVEAKDGLDGIARAQEHQPDGIVLDVMMPGMDGFEAVGFIRAAAPTSKILIYSSADSASSRLKAAQVGADGYLEKSEGVTRLPETLEALCA